MTKHDNKTADELILDNAPEGATHCTDTVPSMNLYAKVEHLGGFYVSLGNRWEQYPIYAGIHLLDDIRAIVERDKRIAELEEVLQKLHKLGGLGLDKHKWIEDVLKGGDL